MRYKFCEICEKKFYPSVRNFNRAKTCSMYCNTRRWRKNNLEKNREIKRVWRRKNGVLKIGSKELRNKISESLKGKMIGKKHPLWKGDDVGYRALHKWVERNLGKADFCQKNINHKSNRYHWANISHLYKRDIDDWVKLCPKCHFSYDYGKCQL